MTPMNPTKARNMSRGDAPVLFGATGDLARRKLIPALYRLDEAGRLDLPVLGVALSDWDDEQFRAHVRDVVGASVPEPDRGVLDRLAGRLSLVAGDYADAATFAALAARLREAGVERPVFYLAIPPSMFPTVVEGLAGVGLARAGRVVVEKPFGRDVASARNLNDVLHEHVDEAAIFRIDHYLGKESVEDLLVFRFGTRSSTRSGTGTTSRASRSPWPRTSGWRVVAVSTTVLARSGTSSRTTCCRWWPCWPWSPP